MASAARLGDSISGTTSGEHFGHLVPHPPGKITGTISGNCSSKVFINGIPAAFVGSATDEHDDCCPGGSGTVATGSSKVFIQGKPAARVGDKINPHNGTANISSGSSNVNFN